MMLPRMPKRVFLAVGNTDMRKSINGLSVLVEQAMDLDPFAGDLFRFLQPAPQHGQNSLLG
jgi:transposase